MPYVKFVNEENKISYDTPEDLERIVHYGCNPLKTSEDRYHYGHGIGDFAGCYPFIGTEAQRHEAYEIASQMLLNNQIYHKMNRDLIRHRIISFRTIDYVIPEDVANLGEFLIRAYGEIYISAYGVHLDKHFIHLHLLINTISWTNGRRFNKPFEMRWLWRLVNGWCQAHEQSVDQELNKKERYQKYLWNE